MEQPWCNLVLLLGSLTKPNYLLFLNAQTEKNSLKEFLIIANDKTAINTYIYLFFIIMISYVYSYVEHSIICICHNQEGHRSRDCAKGSQHDSFRWGWWWRHKMETFSALLALCAGNSPVTGEFPAQSPVTRSFDIFFNLRPKKSLSKQSLG